MLVICDVTKPEKGVAMFFSDEMIRAHYQARAEKLQKEAQMYSLLYPRQHWRFRLAALLCKLANWLYQEEKILADSSLQPCQSC